MDLLRGLSTPPWVVGFFRGLALAVVGFVIVWLGSNANIIPDTAQWALPVAILFLRQVEAFLDQIDPAKTSITSDVNLYD